MTLRSVVKGAAYAASAAVIGYVALASDGDAPPTRISSQP